MKRKLASIQLVQSIQPIPNADAIEIARIQGWQCVVKKGEFQPGESGVFFEIDSVPPDDPRFEFLWLNPKLLITKQPENFRLKTIRLRGVLSQGLLLPLTQFSEISTILPIGTDVTDILHVRKWEAPLPMDDDVAGPFLFGVPKTDEMRMQSVPDVLQELSCLPYVITLKCDGTSATYGFKRDTGEFTVCGRNWMLKRGNSVYWRAAEIYDLEKSLQAYPDLVIQAEVVGPGIQKNRLGLTDTQLRAFNVYDQREGRYLDYDEASALLGKIHVPMVDIVEKGESFTHSLDSLLSLAEGHYPGTQNEREGIVIRPQSERQSATLAGRLSFKAISNRFLLKGGD